MTRVPALDGLRAVAIVMVIGYHVDKDVVPAGHWGVVLFFVLSGYLVTRVLVAEKDRSGRIDLRAFYSKRAVRLFPALIVVCLALLATGTGWERVAPALGHYANYARIQGVFLGLLTHTWFLAVLAHFYVVWPLVIVVLPARWRWRAIGILTVVAVAWRVVAIEVMSVAWVYNATDTNAMALLAGCWLAVSGPRRWRFTGSSIPVLGVLMLLPIFGDRGSGILWGGFIAAALGAIAVEHALARPSWLEVPAIVWVGTISYGLYLWHYVFVRSDIPTWIALVLSVVVATASWYLLERPIQRWGRRSPAPGAETVAG